jgi:two-component system cell cycle response regulator/two-component system cell cycle response regulator DivK
MTDKTILCVEDNPQNRLLVNRILSSQGYKVVEAIDGLAGLDMIRSLKPPMVLLDIDLPKMDGIQVVQHVKADPGLRDIPVIALTASAMQGDKERFLAAGCNDYLSKPIQVQQLIQIVETYYPK